MEFFAATKEYQNVNIFGSNRSPSRSRCVCGSGMGHRRLHRLVAGSDVPQAGRGWIAGETGVLVRNNIQRYLIGEKGSEGQGCFIPGNKIRHISYQSKPEGLAEKVIIDSSFGGGSVIEFKSYDQGQYRFASDSIDFGAYDEEPSHGIYSELTTRTSTNHGIVLRRLHRPAQHHALIEHLAPEFAGGEHKRPEDTGIMNIVIGWDDIPDSLLSQSERKRLRATYGANEVLARTTGIPCVGLGQVYLIPEADFVLPYFEVPDHWPRFFAIDPGFTAPTAIAYFAYDSDNDAIYQIGEHYVKGMPVAVHADAIHRHGDWMPGIIDYAGGNITDGKGVLQEYRKACRNPAHQREQVDLDGAYGGHGSPADRALVHFRHAAPHAPGVSPVPPQREGRHRHEKPITPDGLLALRRARGPARQAAPVRLVEQRGLDEDLQPGRAEGNAQPDGRDFPMTLLADARAYADAHLGFIHKACRGGVEVFGTSPEYERLESAYERLTHNRPLVRRIIGTRLGMRMLLAWTS
jgi:phage terminase large subunit-like protein